MKIKELYIFKIFCTCSICLLVSSGAFSQNNDEYVLENATVQVLLKIESGDKKGKKQLKKLIKYYNISNRQLADHCMGLSKAYEEESFDLRAVFKKADYFKKQALEYYRLGAYRDNDMHSLLKLAFLGIDSSKVTSTSQIPTFLEVKRGFIGSQNMYAIKAMNESAFPHFLEAARRGNGDSQYIVAQSYLNGKAIRKNHELGNEWMSKSIKNGNVEAFNYVQKIRKDNNSPELTVDYKIYRERGAGFFIHPSYILSAAHIIEDADSLKIKNCNGEYLATEIVDIDPKNNLALLKVKSASKDFIAVSGMTKGYINVNDSIFIPRISEEFFIVKKGNIIQPSLRVNDENGNRSGNRIEINAKLLHEDNGTPILNKEFKLLGMSSDVKYKRGFFENEEAEFGITLLDIMEFLIKNKIEISNKPKILTTPQEIQNYLKAISVEINKVTLVEQM